jgi:hypothetical protein
MGSHVIDTVKRRNERRRKRLEEQAAIEAKGTVETKDTDTAAAKDYSGKVYNY